METIMTISPQEDIFLVYLPSSISQFFPLLEVERRKHRFFYYIESELIWLTKPVAGEHFIFFIEK